MAAKNALHHPLSDYFTYPSAIAQPRLPSPNPRLPSPPPSAIAHPFAIARRWQQTSRGEHNHIHRSRGHPGSTRWIDRGV